MLSCGLLVNVRARLPAEAQLTHQSTHTETANLHAVPVQYAQNASVASRPSACAGVNALLFGVTP